MPMIQTIKALSSAQLDVLYRSHHYGWYGVKDKVNTQGMHFKTEMILREGGYIEKMYDIRDEEERNKVHGEIDREIQRAAECVRENWQAAYEHLKKAKHLEIKLERMVYWLTEKGIDAVQKVKG